MDAFKDRIDNGHHEREDHRMAGETGDNGRHGKVHAPRFHYDDDELFDCGEGIYSYGAWRSGSFD